MAAQHSNQRVNQTRAQLKGGEPQDPGNKPQRSRGKLVAAAFLVAAIVVAGVVLVWLFVIPHPEGSYTDMQAATPNEAEQLEDETGLTVVSVDETETEDGSGSSAESSSDSGSEAANESNTTSATAGDGTTSTSSETTNGGSAGTSAGGEATNGEATTTN